MKITAGVDEVGRGSLIGPVFAAVVILKKSINSNLLKDSKSLSKKKKRISMLLYQKKFHMGSGESIGKRNRKPKYITSKFIGYEKSYKKTKDKTITYFNRWK